MYLIAFQTEAKEVEELLELSLESLMKIEVTSVAKKSQSLEDTTAAIYVISREDILRSGVTTIPEALRLAPGVNVARIHNSGWAVSIRGFNGYFSNKLLVLIDGRTVYTPMFSGVLWNQQDVLLQDIDRIEVIRGSGGTLWGANAVNGVINILTRHAKESQGGLLEVSGGNVEEPSTSIRYGGKLNDDAYYRVYGKYANRGNFELTNGSDAQDDWQHEQLGGRLDWQLSDRDKLTLQGDAYYGDHKKLYELGVTSLSTPITATVDTANQYGGNILARWGHKTATGGTTTFQAYYDRVSANEETPLGIVNTWDLDFQHQFSLSKRIDMLWGLGYRRVSYALTSKLALNFDPQNRDLDLFNGFVQGDIALTEKLRLTLGSKIEHNDFTGVEIQPNLRLLWNVSERQSLWAAISRAVRTPSPAEISSRANQALVAGTPPILIANLPNSDLDSEELIAYELGFRSQIRPELSLDIAAFYNVYDRLIDPVTNTTVAEALPAPAHLLRSTIFSNAQSGETYGIETILRWQAKEHWRLEGSYSLLKMAIHADNPLVVDNGSGIEGESPQQQFQLRSYLDLPNEFNFDTSLFWVDELANGKADNYLRLDTHLGWQPLPELSVGLFLQNLLDNRHKEFDPDLYVPSEIPRSVLVRAVWNW
jgi:iron complex outermembrane receptor protein